jgi:hypothetical protein
MPLVSRTAARVRRSLMRGSALALVVVGIAPVASALGEQPAASFRWFPTAPKVGEAVTLASTATDSTSPITGLAWDLGGNGAFAEGGPVVGTTFAIPGDHLVQLRVTDAEGRSAVASETINVGLPVLTLMEPFPVVRFVASERGTGVTLQLLSVEAPKGTRVTLVCRGRGCPVKLEDRVAASAGPGAVTVRFRRFERRLAAGVVLEIRVSESGEIGKYTRLLIRHRKPPRRADECVEQMAPAPIACPA